MTITLETQAQSIEQERRRIGRLLDEVARMCESDMPPSGFYGEMLKRLMDALAAPAGAVYLRSPQGQLQLFYHVNLASVGVDKNETSRESHGQLLQMAMAQPKPLDLRPQTGFGLSGPAAEDRVPPGNPTDFILLLVPILLDEQAVGLLEIFQAANRPYNAVPGFLQYIGLMADLCTRFQRHQKVTQLTGQQSLWTQLETYARQVHASLNPIEVSYVVANEGRRLIECDRIGVAVRYGGKVRVEAVSGADVVERRSNLVQLMTKLCDGVVNWGEKLVFNGAKDDSLPPKVLEALDAYLSESGAKLLVVQPLHDERDGEGASRKKAKSVVVMESFDPPAEPQQLIDRLDIVGRHSVSALYNAVEHRRIPMRFLWRPIAAVQEGLGGKMRAIILASMVGVAFLIAILCLWPYPLKMDAKGQLLPVVRRWVYSPREGHVVKFLVQPNSKVVEGAELVVMFDQVLKTKLMDLRAEIHGAQGEAAVANKNAADVQDQGQRAKLISEAERQNRIARQKAQELATLLTENNADASTDKAGTFYLKAPHFAQDEINKLTDRTWTVLNANFQEEWGNGKTAKPNEAILRLGAKDGPWEIEVKIPQKHIGQIRGAFEELKTDVLEVDYLVTSNSTQTFKGKLDRKRVASEANINREEGAENEPVILAYVSVFREDDQSVPEGYRLPNKFLETSGAEVHAKIRCGDKSMGYSLFYGVWEFLYEKVVFFF